MAAPENQPGPAHTDPPIPPGTRGAGAFSDRVRPGQATGPAAIHAPWRLAYLEGLDEGERSSATSPAKKNGGGSFLAEYWADPAGDVRNHVIVRASHGMILLNAYPYEIGRAHV